MVLESEPDKDNAEPLTHTSRQAKDADVNCSRLSRAVPHEHLLQGVGGFLHEAVILTQEAARAVFARVG